MNDSLITSFLTSRIPDRLAIYQFGSEAKGTTRPGSDIDLAVLARTPLSPEACFNLAQDLSIQLHRDIDLVDLRRATTVMRAQVISTGQRLAVFDRNGTAEFEMYAYSDYSRLNEERREILKTISTRGSIYG
ncbi:MAG: nucleotidyltransferase domain-containing protein [Nitrospiraceae bacterium]